MRTLSIEEQAIFNWIIMLKIDTKRGVFSLPLYLDIAGKNEKIGQREKGGVCIYQQPY